MDIFTVLFYQPIFNLLIILYRLFSENLGLAIIVIALLSRLITLPITLRQLKMAGTAKELNEKMSEIKKKYKNNKEKQQQEMMKVQSEYLPAQLAGCLPLIVQFILFINVYNVIHNIIDKGIESFNSVAYSFVPTFDSSYHLNTNFLGIFDLKSSASAIGLNNPSVIPYLVIVLLVIITQYLSTKYMMQSNQSSQNINAGKEKKNKENKNKNKDEKSEPEDFGAIVQQSTKQTMLLLPMMIGLISYNVASGLGFYWIAQSSFVIIQQFLTKRFVKGKLTPNVV